MLAHAINNPAPSTTILISGNRDFAYALSILRLRNYRIVLITLSNAYPSLRAQGSICFDWISDVLGPVDLSSSHQPISPRPVKINVEFINYVQDGEDITSGLLRKALADTQEVAFQIVPSRG